MLKELAPGIVVLDELDQHRWHAVLHAQAPERVLRYSADGVTGLGGGGNCRGLRQMGGVPHVVKVFDIGDDVPQSDGITELLHVADHASGTLSRGVEQGVGDALWGHVLAVKHLERFDLGKVFPALYLVEHALDLGLIVLLGLPLPFHCGLQLLPPSLDLVKKQALDVLDELLAVVFGVRTRPQRCPPRCHVAQPRDDRVELLVLPLQPGVVEVPRQSVHDGRCECDPRLGRPRAVRCNGGDECAQSTERVVGEVQLRHAVPTLLRAGLVVHDLGLHPHTDIPIWRQVAEAIITTALVVTGWNGPGVHRHCDLVAGGAQQLVHQSLRPQLEQLLARAVNLPFCLAVLALRVLPVFLDLLVSVVTGACPVHEDLRHQALVARPQEHPLRAVVESVREALHKGDGDGQSNHKPLHNGPQHLHEDTAVVRGAREWVWLRHVDLRELQEQERLQHGEQCSEDRQEENHAVVEEVALFHAMCVQLPRGARRPGLVEGLVAL
eukprot:PhM_4_TR3646/c0_g1_i1/m.59613